MDSKLTCCESLRYEVEVANSSAELSCSRIDSNTEKGAKEALLSTVRAGGTVDDVVGKEEHHMAG